MLLSKLAGENGFVLGVEPLPRNVLIVQAQIGLNELSNICCVKNVAISNKNEITYLNRMSSNASISSDDKRNTISVNAVTADSLLDKNNNFSMLKIDVEGYEKNVLEGSRKILSTRPKIALELHVPFLSKYKTTINEIFKLIKIEDYKGVMVFRKDKTKSYPFNPDLIDNDVVNLLLSPRL